MADDPTKSNLGLDFDSLMKLLIISPLATPAALHRKTHTSPSRGLQQRTNTSPQSGPASSPHASSLSRELTTYVHITALIRSKCDEASGWEGLYVREDYISATACSGEVNNSWIGEWMDVPVMCYVQRYIYKGSRH